MTHSRPLPTPLEPPCTALDIRDAALDGIREYLESEGHSVLVGMSGGLGLVYIDQVGPQFVVEIHEP